MVVAAELIAKVSVDGATLAKSELDGVGNAVEKTSGGFKAFLGNALSMATGQFAFMQVGKAVGFLKDMLTDSVKESMDAQASMADTVNVLKSTHDASGMTADAIGDLATKYSHLTKFSDDTIQASENMLLTFTNIGKKVFPDATVATLNLAQKMGGDMKTASIEVGKALNDPIAGIGNLMRIGVTFSDKQKELIKHFMDTNNIAGAQGVILKELSKEFGGAAVAAGQTFGGQLAILKQRFADVKQDIGDKLLPILISLTKIANDNLVPALQNLADGAGTAFGKIGEAVKGAAQYFSSFDLTAIGFAWKQLTDAVNGAIKPFGGVQGIMSGLSPVLSTIGTTLKNNFSQAAVKGIADVAGVISAMASAINGLKTGTGPLSAIGNAIQVVWHVMQGVGTFIAATFKPVWDQLVHTFNAELKPAWDSLVKAIQPLLPALKTFGQFLLGVVAVAITVVIGLIGGLIHGLASALSGIISIIGGIASVISGAVKIIAGIISFIVDLATGKFDKLGQDLGTIMDGIGTMFHGIWEIIKGVFQTAIGFIVGFVSGFVETIIGIVQNLSNTLVGHSIIPDMINSIVNWFAQLPGRVIAFVVNLVEAVINRFNWLRDIAGQAISLLVNNVVNFFSQLPGRALGAVQSLAGMIGGFFSGLAASAFAWGSNIIQGVINGINSMIGEVSGAASNIAATIKGFFPHSPAKEGPLRDLPTMGTEIANQLGQGMKAGTPAIKVAATQMVSAIVTPRFPSMSASSTGAATNQPIILVMDGRVVGRGIMPYVVPAIRNATGVRIV